MTPFSWSRVAAAVAAALFILVSPAVAQIRFTMEPGEDPTYPLRRDGVEIPNVGPDTRAVSLPDGSVAIVELTNTRLFDPHVVTASPYVGALTSVTPHPALGAGFAVAVLHDGAVLAAGGCSGTTCRAASLVHPGAGSSLPPVNQLITGRRNATMTTMRDGRVLIVGGRDAAGSAVGMIEIYDPATRTFQDTGFDLAAPRWGHTATLTADGYVIITGGRNSSQVFTSIVVISPAGAPAAAGNLPWAGFDQTAVLLPSGRVLVFGGFYSTTGTTRSGQIATLQLQPGGGVTVQELFPLNPPPMPYERAGAAAVALSNGLVLIVGGDSFEVGDSWELYDPGSGFVDQYFYHGAIIRTGGGSLVDRIKPSAHTLPNGDIFVVGTGVTGPTAKADVYFLVNDGAGVSSSGTLYGITLRPGWHQVRRAAASTAATDAAGALLGNGLIALFGNQEIDVVDPVANTVLHFANRTAARSGGAAVALDGPRAVFIGGGSTSQAAVVFTITGALAQGPATASTVRRVRPSVARLPDGRVLVLGGLDLDSLNSSTLLVPGAVSHASAELFTYNAVTGGGTLTPTGSSSVGRYGSTLTVMPGGRVFAVGGLDGQRPNAVVEEYDPASGTFMPAGTLVVPRAFHSATPLDATRILIAGGLSIQEDLQPLGSSRTLEIYDTATGTSQLLTTTLLQPRASHAAVKTVTYGRDAFGRPTSADTILFAGGQSGSERSSELLDIATFTSQLQYPMEVSRDRASAWLLADGRVAVAGWDGGTTAAIETFQDGETPGRVRTLLNDQVASLASTVDAVVNSLTDLNTLAASYSKPGGPAVQMLPTGLALPAARSGGSALVLRDGRVLFAGGGGIPSATERTADLYDPQAGTVVRLPGKFSFLENVRMPLVQLADGPAGEVRIATTGPYQVTMLTIPANGAAPIYTDTSLISPLAPPAALVALQDGSVLVAGNSNLLQRVSPFTGTRGLAGALPTSRGRLFATREAAGTILLTGESTTLAVGLGEARQVLRFDPQTPRPRLQPRSANPHPTGATKVTVTSLWPGTVIPAGYDVVFGSSTSRVTSGGTVAANGTVTLTISPGLQLSLDTGSPFSLEDRATAQAATAGATQLTLQDLSAGTLTAGTLLSAGTLRLVVAADVVPVNGTATVTLRYPLATALAASSKVIVEAVSEAGLLDHPRTNPIFIPLADGRLLIAGGQTLTLTAGGTLLTADDRTIELFDPASGSTRLLVSRLLSAAAWTNAVGVPLPHGRVAIVGANDIQVIEVDEDAISIGSALPSTRTSVVAAADGDGRVFITGAPSPDIDIFEPGVNLADRITELSEEVGSLVSERSALQANVTALQQSLATATGQNVELEGDVQHLQDQLAGVTQQLSNAQAQITWLLQQLNTSNTTTTNLQLQVADLQRQLAEAHDALSSTAAQFATTQSQLAGANTIIGTKDALIVQQGEVISALATENLSLQAALTAAQGEIGTLTASLAAANGQVAELVIERDALRMQLTGAAETIAAREATIAERDRQLAALTDANASLQDQLASANSRIDALTGDLAAAHLQIATLTSERDALRADLTAANQRIADVSAERDALSADLGAANQQIARLTVERDALQARLDAATALVETQGQEIATQGQQIASQGQQITAQGQQLAQQASTVETLNERVSALNGQITTLTAERQALETRLDAATAAVASTLSLVETTFRRLPGGTTFRIPGQTREQQLVSLATAVAAANQGSQIQVYRAMGGR